MKRNVPLKSAIFIYVAGLALGSVLGLVVAIFAEEMSDGAYVFLSYALTQIGFLVPVVIYAARRKNEITDIFPLAKPKIKALPFTILVSIGAFMQNLLPATAVETLFGLIGVGSNVNIPDLTEPVNAVLAVLLIAALPAIAEEFLFRGVMAGAAFKSAYFMMFYSAAVFAVGHLSPVQMVHQFILGAVLVFLVYSTGTVWYSVLVHFFNNVLALFTVYIPGYAEAVNFSGAGAWVFPVMCIIGIAVLYPSVNARVKYHKGGRLGGYASSDGIIKTVMKRGGREWYISVAVPEDEARRDNAYALGLIVCLAVLTVLNAALGALGA